MWKQLLSCLSKDLLRWKLERVKGFEPSTPTLARLCSTTELHPRRIYQNRMGCSNREPLEAGIIQALRPCKRQITQLSGDVRGLLYFGDKADISGTLTLCKIGY